MVRLARLALLAAAAALGVLAAPVPDPEPQPGAGAAVVDSRAPAALPPAGARGDPIPGSFIITLRPGLSAPEVGNHFDWVSGVHGRDLGLMGLAGIRKTFTATHWKGYVGDFNHSTMEAIRANPQVAAVEPDRVWTASNAAALTTQNPATWGLGTISHKSSGSSSYIYSPTSGQGTYAYVVDTGINQAHVEFGGRAQLGYNAVGGDFVDSMGHGTHVSGTLAGQTYGVAKQATIVAVKVFASGSSSTSTIMDGYQWAVSDIVAKGRQGKAIINLSLGGTQSDAFNTMINNANTHSGIVTVVAAGNDGADAAGYSPSSAAGAIVVGAITSAWQWASYSNYGQLVDVAAPGSSVISAWIGSATATATMSGTSMACPHVAGLALYIMSVEGLAGPATILSRIVQLSTGGKISTLPAGTANLIAYNGSGQ